MTTPDEFRPSSPALDEIRAWARQLESGDPHGELSYLVPHILALVDEIERLERCGGGPSRITLNDLHDARYRAIGEIP